MESYILFYILLTEYANTELKKDEVHMLWIALQTSLQATKAKFTDHVYYNTLKLEDLRISMVSLLKYFNPY